MAGKYRKLLRRSESVEDTPVTLQLTFVSLRGFVNRWQLGGREGGGVTGVIKGAEIAVLGWGGGGRAWGCVLVIRNPTRGDTRRVLF